MENILLTIEKSIPDALKNNLSKRYIISISSFLDLSSKLKNMVQSYNEIKEILFLNNDEALYYSGDILAKTLHDYWIRGGNIQQIFIINAQATSFYAGFKCIW